MISPLEKDLPDTENRAIVFAHYDKQDMVDPYVYFYLGELRKICRALIFVSTARLERSDVDELERLGCNVILRGNSGYDFMSYRAGLEALEVEACDEVVICNDSVYGPFFELQKMFSEMGRLNGIDFWGITTSTHIAYHLQSYFIVFKKNVLRSTAFKNFWQSVTALDSKAAVIKNYEAAMTSRLMESGLKAAAYVEYQQTAADRFSYLAKRFSVKKIGKKIKAMLQGEAVIPRINITHSFWKELILQRKMPFLKIEILRENPIGVDVDDYESVIGSVSDYDCNLIKNHLERLANQKAGKIH